MKIYGKSIRLSQLFFLTIYYGFAQYLLIPIALFDHLEWQATGLEFIV